MWIGPKWPQERRHLENVSQWVCISTFFAWRLAGAPDWCLNKLSAGPESDSLHVAPFISIPGLEALGTVQSIRLQNLGLQKVAAVRGLGRNVLL